MFDPVTSTIKKMLGKYEPKIRRIPWVAASHAFVFFLVFVAVELLIAGMLMYWYIFLPNFASSAADSSPEQFKESLYTSVLSQQAERQQVLDASALENFPTPF